MNTIPPSVAERFNLLRFACNVIDFAIFYVTGGCRPLKVAIELDAVGRVEENALHFAAEPFTFRQTGHHL